MTLHEVLKNSINIGLHAVVMGLLIIPFLWFSGGLSPRQDEPVQPTMESKLPLRLMTQ